MKLLVQEYAFSGVSLSGDKMCWLYIRKELSRIPASASFQDLFYVRILSLQLKMLHLYSSQEGLEMLSALVPCRFVKILFFTMCCLEEFPNRSYSSRDLFPSKK